VAHQVFASPLAEDPENPAQHPPTAPQVSPVQMRPRETTLASANQQLQMDQQQFQQVNMLLVELQQRGVITVSDGRVFINQ